MTTPDLYIAVQQIRSEKHIFCITGNTFSFQPETEIKRRDLEIVYAPDKPSILEQAAPFQHPKRKLYAKRVTPLPIVPCSSIRRLVGNFHVSTADAQIIAEITSRIEENGWSCDANIKGQTKAVAIAFHQQNRDFFNVNRF